MGFLEKIKRRCLLRCVKHNIPLERRMGYDSLLELGTIFGSTYCPQCETHKIDGESTVKFKPVSSGTAFYKDLADKYFPTEATLNRIPSGVTWESMKLNMKAQELAEEAYELGRKHIVELYRYSLNNLSQEVKKLV
jgi:hypothetical protein